MHCDFFLRSESEGSKRTPRDSAIDLSCSVVHSCYQLHETAAGSDDNDHQNSDTKLQRDTPDGGRNATRKQARAGSTAAAALRVKGSLFVIGNSIESQADATERVAPKISATRCGELGEKRK